MTDTELLLRRAVVFSNRRKVCQDSNARAGTRSVSFDGRSCLLWVRGQLLFRLRDLLAESLDRWN